MQPSRRTGLAFGLAAGLLVIFLTRLPQLLGERLMLDGDECLLGVMARHALQGQGLPLFFYGQDYAFTPLEAGIAALFFACFGSSVVAFKAAMLSFWAAGWVCWVLAVRRLSDGRTAALAGALLATASAWGVMGMKGGATFLTGFVALGLALLALASLREPALPRQPLSPRGQARPSATTQARAPARARVLPALILGLAVVILWLSQVHFLLTLLPFGVLCLVPRRRRADLLPAAAVVLVALAALRWMPPPKGVIRSAPTAAILERTLAQLPGPAVALERLTERTRIVFSGAYFFSFPVDPGPFTAAAGRAWLLVFGAALAAVAALKPLRSQRLAWACAIAALPSAALAVLVPDRDFQFRYLLPLTCVAGVLVALCLAWLLGTGRAGRVLAAGVLLVLCGTGVLAMAEFRKGSWASRGGLGGINERAALEQLVRFLEAEGIHHAWTRNDMLRWKIVFASREGVVTAITAENDRYPDYARRVREAALSGEPFAVITERYLKAELPEARPFPGIPAPRVTEVGSWIVESYALDELAARALAPPGAPAPTAPAPGDVSSPSQR